MEYKTLTEPDLAYASKCTITIYTVAKFRR